MKFLNEIWKLDWIVLICRYWEFLPFEWIKGITFFQYSCSTWRNFRGNHYYDPKMQYFPVLLRGRKPFAWYRNQVSNYLITKLFKLVTTISSVPRIRNNNILLNNITKYLLTTCCSLVCLFRVIPNPSTEGNWRDRSNSPELSFICQRLKSVACPSAYLPKPWKGMPTKQRENRHKQNYVVMIILIMSS